MQSAAAAESLPLREAGAGVAAIDFPDCRGAGDTLRIGLRLPMRVVIATDFSRAYDIGRIFEPRINADLRHTTPGGDWPIDESSLRVMDDG